MNKIVNELVVNNVVEINDLRIELIEDELEVSGWSNFQNLKNISKNEALKEIETIKEDFDKTINEDLDFRKFTQSKSISFFLLFDDYGKGSVDICFEKDGIIEWIANLE